jgi:hypothetical protein
MNERFAERQKTVNQKKQMKRERLAERLKNSQARRQFIAHIKYGTY